MSDDKDTLFKTVITSGMLGGLGAMIRALLTKHETPLRKLSNFAAGVAFAILLGWILRHSNLSEMWREIIVACGGAFVTNWWPNLERLISQFVTNYVKKKTDDIIMDSNPGKPPRVTDDRSDTRRHP